MSRQNDTRDAARARLASNKGGPSSAPIARYRRASKHGGRAATAWILPGDERTSATSGFVTGSRARRRSTRRASMSTAALDPWGWRIPFLLGLVVGIAGYILRRYVLETAAVEKRARPPIIETLHEHWRAVAGFAGLSVYSAVSFYIGFVYLVSWLQTADGIPPSRSLEINSLSMVILLPVVITAGWLSDGIGRKPLMVVASIGRLIGAVPLFW